jgi:hypothetical protein
MAYSSSLAAPGEPKWILFHTVIFFVGGTGV